MGSDDVNLRISKRHFACLRASFCGSNAVIFPCLKLSFCGFILRVERLSFLGMKLSFYWFKDVNFSVLRCHYAGLKTFFGYKEDCICGSKEVIRRVYRRHFVCPKKSFSNDVNLRV